MGIGFFIDNKDGQRRIGAAEFLSNKVAKEFAKTIKLVYSKGGQISVLMILDVTKAYITKEFEIKIEDKTQKKSMAPRGKRFNQILVSLNYQKLASKR